MQIGENGARLIVLSGLLRTRLRPAQCRRRTGADNHGILDKALSPVVLLRALGQPKELYDAFSAEDISTQMPESLRGMSRIADHVTKQAVDSLPRDAYFAELSVCPSGLATSDRRPRSTALYGIGLKRYRRVGRQQTMAE